MKKSFLDISSWITVELTNFCNYSCPNCSQFNSKLFKKGFMKEQVFYSIIDDLVKNKIKISNLNPFFRGESLAHPDFAKLLNYAINKLNEFNYMEYIVIHTNGYFLDIKNSNAILNACDQSKIKHPGNLVLSLDSSDKIIYSKIRVGGNLNIVEKNIEKFIKERENRKQFGPNIILQFIVQPLNMSNCVDFMNIWKERLKKWSSKKVNISFSKDNEPLIIKSDTIYFRMLESDSISIEKNRELYLKAMDMINA